MKPIRRDLPDPEGRKKDCQNLSIFEIRIAAAFLHFAREAKKKKSGEFLRLFKCSSLAGVRACSLLTARM
jgi:hypothetical protein